MIDSVRGTLLSKDAAGAVVEVGGLGLRLTMPATAIGALPSIGEEARLYTLLSIHEDTMTLYGFSDEHERALFERMRSVSGIGPKMAIAALSTFSADRLAHCIASGDVDQMATIPGVGRKKAQRVILELRGTIEEALSGQPTLGSLTSSASDSAQAALLSMGFSPAEAELALEGYDGSDESDAIKYALKRLGSAR